MPQNEEIKEKIEKELMQKVESLRFIVTGLEHHEPFIKLVEMWRETEQKLDANWHHIYDPLKLIEARATKYATAELTGIVELLRSDLVAAEFELETLRNPDKFQSKHNVEE